MPRNLGFSDGSSMSVDRTREAGERTLGFSDGSSLKVNRATGKKDDRAGESRPLLGKLVGRSSIAFSLRDLHDKQGNNKVVRVRRAGDNLEKDFKANELSSIVDWTNGKLDTTLPADIGNDSENITQFTLSGIESDFNSTYTVVGSYNGKPKWQNSNESDIEIKYRGEGKWEIDNDGDGYYIADDTGKDYPWAVTSWSVHPDGSGSASNTPIFSSFVGGNIGASAAYSLRKVKANYSDNVVRIRRSSDNLEVEVGFDSEGKVSANSPITDGGTELTPNPDADLGSTTATDLNGFLNDEHESTIGGFGAGSTFYHLNISNVTKNGVVAKKYSASEDAIGTNQFLAVNGSAFDVRGGVGVVDSTRSKAVYKFRYYVDSTESPNVNYFHFKSQNGGGSAHFTEGNVFEVVKDSWQTLTLTLPAGQTGMSDAWYIFISDTNSNQKPSSGSITIGDGFYITPTHQVTYSNASAFVHTWYDQAGSYNATQSDAAKQPKIAENGALLADGISFDGVNSFLNTDGVFTDNREASIFIKVKALTSDATGSDWFYTEGYSGENGSVAQTIGVGITDTGNIADITASTDINANDGQASVLANGGVISLIGGSSTSTSHINGTSMGSITTPTNADGNYTITTSGGIGGHSSTSSLAKFSLDELILYTSDQSANRFKIESNINNHYNLYTPTNSAFVDIWYDQGGGNYHLTQIEEELQPTIVNNGVYLGGLYAPVNNATSGSKVHMISTFRNQNFPANTTGISYFLVGHDLNSDNGNNKGTLFGAFRGVANYAEGQQAIALDGMTQFGFYNGLTTDANHFQYKTVSVPSSTFPNKTVLLVASIQDKKGTLYVNETTNSGDMVRVGGTALENLNLESDPSVDADRHYIRLFAPNRDMAYRAHNYSYGTIKEAILYPSSNTDNLEAIRDNINNQYQIY